MAYCNWDTTSELNIRYHNEEWGVPLHDDRGQFEFLMMEVRSQIRLCCGTYNQRISPGGKIFTGPLW